MTTPTPQIRTQLQADGSTTIFACGFALQDASHVKAYITSGSNAPVLQTGIMVTDVGLDKSASVTLASAPANGDLVTLVRDVPAGDESAYLDALSFDADSLEDALHLLHGERGDVLTMEMFGAVGDGSTNDSAAWNAMITAAHESGKTVLLANRSYNISGATTKDLDDTVTSPATTGHPVSIIGIGNPTLNGGANGVTLFRTQKYGLTFRNVNTKNVCLIHSPKNTATTDIDLVDIRNWTWSNTTGHSLILRIKRSETALALKRLILRDINGQGGLGGMSFECPIENVDIDNYTVSGIVVPDDDAHFENNGKMRNSGYGDGLLLGDDDPDAQDVCQSWSIGRVSVSDVEDKREQRNGALIASCDGVRFQGANISAGQINVRDVRSEYEEDTTGVYFKGRNAVVGTIYIENAGGHEAGCVFKGARRLEGANAEGFNISVETLKLFADDDDDRCAVYFGTDDIRVGFLSIEGYGGDVVDSNGELRKGSGPLVFCESTDKRRLHIDRYSIMNCKLGEAAVGGTGRVQLFALRGYEEIKIGPGFVTGISNDRWASRPPIDVFRWTDNKNRPVRSIEIGSVQATEFSSGTGQVTLFNLDSAKRLDHFAAWNPIVDNSVDVGLEAKSSSDIGRLQVIGGDLSACAVAAKDLNGTTPATEFSTCNGL